MPDVMEDAASLGLILRSLGPMIASLLLLLAALPDDTVGFTLTPRNRLSVVCGEAACLTRVPSYRVDAGTGEAPLDGKARAVANDGSYCSVVGARRCTKKQRTIFRTDFSD